MDIKKVEIGYLKNPRKTGIIQEGLSVYKLEKEVIEEKICFILGDKAVDIDNFDSIYPIVKRNTFNQILPEQIIKEGLLYGLNVKDLTKKDLSILKKVDYRKKEKQYKKINR